MKAALVVGLLLLASAVASKKKESPKGQPCCDIPTSLAGLAPFDEPWFDKCPRICPGFNKTAATVRQANLPLPDTARRYCYRGSEKSGTSITLLLLHDLINKAAPLMGYTVKHIGGTWQQSLGFQATIFDNKTIMLEAKGTGILYKHGTSMPTDCHLIVSLRDPRDMTVSWWHHKHRIEKEPVPENWYSRGRIPGFAFNPHAFYHGANRYGSVMFIDRTSVAGFLPLTFKATTQDMLGTLYQLSEYFQLEVYDAKYKADIEQVFHDMRTLYDRSHAWDLIKKYEETGEVAPRSDWFGVTHFNSGRVGDYLKELTAADVEAMDGIMCNVFPMQAGLWGAANCTVDASVKATKTFRGPMSKKGKWP